MAREVGRTVIQPLISVFVATSLDGYIATEDDDLDWLESAGGSDEDYGFQTFLIDVDLVAMGRGTYNYIAHIDPLPYGGRPVEVFTHNPPDPRPDVTFGSWTPREATYRWATKGLRHVYVDGGNLISQFLAAGLIDDLTITIVPILLGKGRPLFHRSDNVTPLELVASRSFPSGMVLLRYRRP